MLKFTLLENQIITQIKVLSSLDNLTIEKHMCFSILKTYNHLGLLPRGYYTRVINKNISYDTCLRKLREIKASVDPEYTVSALKVPANNVTLIALIKRV